MKRVKPGKVVRLRAGRADIRSWEDAAKANGLSLSEYIRRKLNNKPVRPQRRQSEAEAAEEIAARGRAESEERERLQQIAATNRAMRERDARFNKAERLANAAGGVVRWFGRMSSE